MGEEREMMVELGRVGRSIYGEGLLGKDNGFRLEARVCKVCGFGFCLANLELRFLKCVSSDGSNHGVCDVPESLSSFPSSFLRWNPSQPVSIFCFLLLRSTH